MSGTDIADECLFIVRVNPVKCNRWSQFAKSLKWRRRSSSTRAKNMPIEPVIEHTNIDPLRPWLPGNIPLGTDADGDFYRATVDPAWMRVSRSTVREYEYFCWTTSSWRELSPEDRDRADRPARQIDIPFPYNITWVDVGSVLEIIWAQGYLLSMESDHDWSIMDWLSELKVKGEPQRSSWDAQMGCHEEEEWSGRMELEEILRIPAAKRRCIALARDRACGHWPFTERVERRS